MLTALLFTVVLAAPRPNVVVIFCDDLGYGDLTSYGHPTIRTPNLDRMADEGLRATQFYVAASVCTPSRAGLMTGRLPVRNGMCGDRAVLFPDSVGGLPQSETTMAEMFRDAGYATAMVGKWHLGHLPQYLPTNHGFETYFGIPYSNDMDKTDAGKAKKQAVWNEPDYRDFNVPLLEGTAADGCRELERPAVQTNLTRRYTDRAIEDARRMAGGDRPFFLYLAHNLPHVPLFRSDDFAGVSEAGVYGDVVEEIDDGVGRLLDALEQLGIDEQTLVVFTSDNGPWLSFGPQGGSPGPLHEGKGTTWEGGMRVPGIFRWPGTIPAGRIDSGLASTLDLLPTFAELAGGVLPDDVAIDGVDQTAWLRGGDSARDAVFFYRGYELMAVRLNDHKAHFVTRGSYGSEPRKPVRHDPPLLYDLAADIGERTDLADKRPETLAEIQTLVAEHRRTMRFADSQLDRRPAGGGD